jgi:hypothetical protein
MNVEKIFKEGLKVHELSRFKCWRPAGVKLEVENQPDARASQIFYSGL